ENKSSVGSVSGLAKAEQPQILPNHCKRYLMIKPFDCLESFLIIRWLIIQPSNNKIPIVYLKILIYCLVSTIADFFIILQYDLPRTN
ncbi:hypothetical protein, partial [uncultured Duncaniella sp.]